MNQAASPTVWRSTLTRDLSLASAAVLTVISCMFASAGVVCAVAVFIIGAAAFRLQSLPIWIVFLLPFSPLLEIGLPLHDSGTVLRILVFLVFVMGEVLRRRGLKDWFLRSRFERVFLCYVGVAFVSVTISGHVTHSAMRALLQLFSYACIYYLFVGWELDERLIARIFCALIISTFLVCLFGYYQAAVGGYTAVFRFFYPPDLFQAWAWNGRITSFLNYSNSLAGYLNLVSPLAIAIMFAARSHTARAVAAACLLGILFSLLLTESRGGLVVFAMMLLLGMHYFIRNRKRSIAMILIAVLLFGASVAVVMQSSDHFVDVASAVSRLELWKAAWTMFTAHPLLGVGYGTFRDSYDGLVTIDDLEGAQLDSHNLFLQTLAETGILGLLLFLTLMAMAISSARRRLLASVSPYQRILAFTAMAAVIGVLAHGMVDYLFQTSTQFGSLFWALLGLLFATDRLPVQKDVFGNAAA